MLTSQGYLTGFDKTTVKSALDAEVNAVDHQLHRNKSSRIATFTKTSRKLQDDIANLGLVLWQMVCTFVLFSCSNNYCYYFCR
jgi:hypothetical protein